MGHWFESSIAHLGEAVVYSVSEITAKIKSYFDTAFDTVTIEGEVSNFRPSTTGHLYFTLKEKTLTSEVAISAVMFKNAASRLNFKLENGMKVQATGNITIYGERGTYQVVCNTVELAGEGEILRLLEERKRKLETEGLFSKSKRALPTFVTRIAVITSPTGAAIRDILKIAKKRNPKLQVTVLPAVVHGEKAASSLIEQLRIANEYNLGQLVIIGRGGGSLEDLLPFSDEALVREIAASKLPVISAVGHEIDIALSDYAADYRAATPSEAAEIAVPLLEDILLDISDKAKTLEETMKNKLERVKLMVASFSKENLDSHFNKIISPFLQRCDEAREGLCSGIMEKITQTKHNITLYKQGIELSNPKTILARGFSIVKKQDGSLVRSSSQVKPGETLTITPSGSDFTVTVNAVKD